MKNIFKMFKKQRNKVTRDINEIHLTIDDIKFFSYCIIIEWSSDLGFGKYTIRKERDGSISVNSESMDKGDDKAFIKKLMELFIEKLIIKQ